MPDRLAVIDLLRAAGVECHTRAQWGSPQERAGAYARRRITHPMPSGPADYHFLHITVTADTDTVQQGAAGARQVETYGYSSPPMVSYQDLVTNEGRYLQGQDYGTKGTHTVNDKRVPGYPEDLNLYGYACALMQNVGDAVTDEQVRLVAMVFAARELTGWVRRGAPILPHRMFAEKSCPGDRAMARIDEIRRLKDTYVREGLPNLQEDDMAQYAEQLDRIEQRTNEIATALEQVKRQNAKVREKVTRLIEKTKKGDAATLAELEAIEAALTDHASATGADQ